MQSLQTSLTTPHQSSIPNPNLNPTASSAASQNIQSVIASTVDLVEPYADSQKTSAGHTLPQALHVVTPLVYSEALSREHDVYLKMDCLQPSGSFKIRGVGAVCQEAFNTYGPQTYIVTSSGGNAGLAAATAAKTLGVRCLVVVPRKTEAAVVRMLTDLGAEVDNSTAEVWDDADRIARAFVAQHQGATYVHPFVGDTLTLGHASLIHELALQLPSHGITEPSLLICSVGGGGLIRGLIHGLESTNALGKPKIIGVNDFGADSFAQSWNTWLQTGGEPAVVTIPGITSKATSMGARTCSIETLHSAIRYADSTPGSRDTKFTSLTVSDDISGSACWQFKRDHGLMVEMACGAAVSPCYQPRIMEELLKGVGKEGERKTIVVVVCGGSKVDELMLRVYEREYGLARGEGFRAMVDGRMLYKR